MKLSSSRSQIEEVFLLGINFYTFLTITFFSKTNHLFRIISYKLEDIINLWGIHDTKQYFKGLAMKL